MEDPRYCKGGGNTCEDCRGSCGIEDFDIFVAGFEHSSEGFNGEYVNSTRYPSQEALRDSLRVRYDQWLKTGQIPW